MKTRVSDAGFPEEGNIGTFVPLKNVLSEPSHAAL